MADPDTILLVEDDDNDTVLFCHAVEQSGCHARLRHFGLADAAMRHMDELRAKERPLPRIVFIDLFLPNIRGTHLVTWMKRSPHFRAIPAIVITGLAPPRAADDLAVLGANAVMVKPGHPIHFQEAIGAACTFWLKYCLRS